MITVRPHPTELFALHASVDGLAVFLDYFAIKHLAKDDPDRRRRFIATLGRGVDVMFCVSNAAELSGPQESSFHEIRAFLEEIDTHWFPVELDPVVCVEREARLQEPLMACFSEDLLKVFTATRLKRSPEIELAGLPASLPSDFFRLGVFMDWLAPQRQDIMRRKAEMGVRLRDQIMEHSAKYRRNPAWLDANFPPYSFRADRPATFVYLNLVRLLILEAKARVIVPNDGIDFAQAVIGSAYASVATLDKDWKRRVEMVVPKGSLAHIYYQPELDKMVLDLERYLDRASLQRGRALFTVN